MTEFNACFISYRHPNDDSAKRFVQTFVDELSAQLQMNLPNARIFFDRDGIKVGDLFNEELALQLCRSACLVICYGPRHFDLTHRYCTLEYLGMRQLEERRRRDLNNYLDRNGLIFPVVFRGFASLPVEITNTRQCIQFDDVVEPADFRRRRRREKIRQLPQEIYDRWDQLERGGIFANHDCSGFGFPASEVDLWLSQNANPTRTPMPGR